MGSEPAVSPLCEDIVQRRVNPRLRDALPDVIDGEGRQAPKTIGDLLISRADLAADEPVVSSPHFMGHFEVGLAR